MGSRSIRASPLVLEGAAKCFQGLATFAGADLRPDERPETVDKNSDTVKDVVSDACSINNTPGLLELQCLVFDAGRLALLAWNANILKGKPCGTGFGRRAPFVCSVFCCVFLVCVLHIV